MGRHIISGALLNFLNVEQWTPETLLQYAKDHGENQTLHGVQHGHDPWVESRVFPGKRFCYDPNDRSAIDLNAAGPAQELGFKNGQVCLVDKEYVLKYTLPGESEYQDFLDYLGAQLRAEWIDRIREYQEKGKLSGEYMDHLRATLTISFFNDFRVYAYCNVSQIEAWLERDFFNTIAFGGGDIFKRFRSCKNPQCGKWFLYNRPKQESCSDDCRRNYHNRKNIDSGYIRDFIRRKREEDPSTYMPKIKKG